MANAVREYNFSKCCIKKKQYFPALANLCVVITRQPHLKSDVKSDFLAVLDHCVHNLENNQRWDDALHCYENALQVFGECEEINYGIGNFLLRTGHTVKAAEYYHKALFINPHFLPASYSLECANNLLVERWHFPMLNDRNRNDKFQKAIRNLVQQGHNVVLDIGCGTGIFSMIASKSGARQIYSCDCSEAMCNVCDQVLAANGMSRSVTLIRKMSTELNFPSDIPERISLVVAEIFDAGLFGEHSLKAFHHAWRSLLFPRASECDTVPGSCEMHSKVIPEGAVVWIFPIESSWIRRHNRVVNEKIGPVPNEATIFSKNDEPYSSEHLLLLPGGYRLLADPVCLFQVNFNDPDDIEKYLNGHYLEVEVNMKSEGTIDAIAMNFDLHLNKELHLSSAPEAKGCWEQAVFHVLDTINVQEGTKATMKFFCQGHLMLQDIFAKGITMENISNASRKLFLRPEWILKLNNIEFCLSIFSSLQSAVDAGQTTVVDISPIPLGCLFAAFLGVKTVVVLDSVGYTEVLDLCQLLNVPATSVSFTTIDDLIDQRDKYDVLLFDPVESSGLLRSRVIEDVTILRNSCLKSSGTLIPKNLKIMGITVDSHDLIQTARLDSRNLLGFKISEFLNLYQAKLQQDLHITTLPYQAFSEVVQLFEIAYANPNVEDILKNSQAINTTVICDGQISALLFWFRIEFSDGAVMDTSNPSTLYNHGAFILQNELNVKSGQTTMISSVFKQNVLDFSIDVE